MSAQERRVEKKKYVCNKQVGYMTGKLWEMYGEGQQAAGAKNNKSEFVHKYLCFESLLFYFWVSLISSVSSFLP